MEAAVQAVYLIGVADLSSTAAIPNQAQFPELTRLSEDLIDPASNKQQLEVIVRP